MKRKVYFLIAMILLICLFLATASAGTWGEWTQKYKDELEEIQNAEVISFSPEGTERFNYDWMSSSNNRSWLSFLLALDIYTEGYPEAAWGLVNYNSFIGITSENVYIITGMYEGHTFVIAYSSKEHSGTYQVTATNLSEAEIQSTQKSIISSMCSKYYANDKKEIRKIYDSLSSSGK